METRIDEIADGIYRLSTHFAETVPPQGFTFNQFLIKADEPMLFHCGMRGLFPLVSEAVAKIMPIDRLRWISFGHFEADECGSMNQWLAAAPHAQVAHGQVACDVQLNDAADRAPRVLADDEVIDLGGKRMRYMDTPHVPHCWDAGMMYEEATGTMFSGDLLSHLGNPAAVTAGDLLEPAIMAEEIFKPSSVGAYTAPTIRRLAALKPKTLAVMHGASFNGDCARTLNGLADYYAGTLQKLAA